MRYAIFSDIHANLEALNRAISDAREQGAEKFICLGDVVGYGPQPAETLSRLREINALIIAGNHDDAVSGRDDANSFIDLASDAVARHRDALSADELKFLRELPYTEKLNDDVIIAHGDICEPSKFYYVENEEDARANFNACESRVIFVGHTHTPTIFLTGSSGNVYQLEPQDFTIEDEKRYIVNPGSVGYPRECDGRCISSYIIYDSCEQTIFYRFLAFSVASVMQRGRDSRHLSKKLVAIIATIATILIATIISLIASRDSENIQDINRELIVASCEIKIEGGENKLFANLELEKGSAQAQLNIVYFDENNKPLAIRESATVKKSSTKSFMIPPLAIRAELTILRNTTNDIVAIKTFKPAHKKN